MDANGLDEVPTRMTQLNLAGFNPLLGPVSVMLDPNQPTLGQIEEKVQGIIGVLDVAPFGKQGCGNSYFNVHAILKLGQKSVLLGGPLAHRVDDLPQPPLPARAT